MEHDKTYPHPADHTRENGKAHRIGIDPKVDVVASWETRNNIPRSERLTRYSEQAGYNKVVRGKYPQIEKLYSQIIAPPKRFPAVYRHSVEYARKHDELDLYRESYRANVACAAAIDTAVRDSNYELYRYDLADAAKSVVAEHGPDRTAWVLANTIRGMDYDGRISQKHKQWAQEHPVPEGYKRDFYLNTHPTVLDGLIDHAREEINNHLRAAEMSTEQNYNMLDGRINNEAAPKADLTDGQTYEEIRELAPETLPSEKKPSLLGQLARLKENLPEQKPLERSGNDSHER